MQISMWWLSGDLAWDQLLDLRLVLGRGILAPHSKKVSFFSDLQVRTEGLYFGPKKSGIQALIVIKITVNLSLSAETWFWYQMISTLVVRSKVRDNLRLLQFRLDPTHHTCNPSTSRVSTCNLSTFRASTCNSSTLAGYHLQPLHLGASKPKQKPLFFGKLMHSFLEAGQFPSSSCMRNKSCLVEYIRVEFVLVDITRQI